MKTTTTYQAKTHLSELIREVQAGETVVILNGKIPVAKIIAVDSATSPRPPVGTVTSEPVTYDENTFAPLTAEELSSWGV